MHMKAIFLLLVTSASITTAMYTARVLKDSETGRNRGQTDHGLENKNNSDGHDERVSQGGRDTDRRSLNEDSSSPRSRSGSDPQGGIDERSNGGIGSSSSMSLSNADVTRLTSSILEGIKNQFDTRSVLGMLGYLVTLSILLLAIRIAIAWQNSKDGAEKNKSHFCKAGRVLDDLGLMGGQNSCVDCEPQIARVRSGCTTCKKLPKQVAESVKTDLDERVERLLEPVVMRIVREQSSLGQGHS